MATKSKIQQGTFSISYRSSQTRQQARCCYDLLSQPGQAEPKIRQDDGVLHQCAWRIDQAAQHQTSR
jgi:hypothetical protein